MLDDLHNIRYIDERDIHDQRVLLCIDMDVSLDAQGNITNDKRVRESFPTMKHLLKNNNSIILVGKIGRPKGRDEYHSTKKIVPIIQARFPSQKITFFSDFLDPAQHEALKNLKSGEIAVLENMRFWDEEVTGDETFASKLAQIAQVYVNDAFGTAHRKQVSTYTVAQYLPGYAGLSHKREVPAIMSILEMKAEMRIAVMGGAKLETKLRLIKMLQKMDYVLVGGVMANTFLKTLGYDIGVSRYDPEEIETAKEVLYFMAQNRASLILPSDVIVGDPGDTKCDGGVYPIDQIPADANILDIGPKTMAVFGNLIAAADVIFWNGPMGYYENDRFRRGSDFVYHAIAQNSHAHSVLGGGDTLAILADKTDTDNISHISSGGGAMFDLLAQGTLPALEALRGSGN